MKAPRNLLLVIGIVLVIMGGVMARSALMMALDIDLATATGPQLPPDDPRAVADFEARREGLTLQEQLALARRMGLVATAAKIDAEIDRQREPVRLAAAGGSVLLLAFAAMFVFRKALRTNHEESGLLDVPEDAFRIHRQADPHLSHPALIHFMHALIQRATLASVGLEPWEPLQPFIDPRARQAIEDQNSHIRTIGEITVGDIVLTLADRGTTTCLDAEFRGYQQQEMVDGSIRLTSFEGRWRLRRPVDARSLPAKAMLYLGCPECGTPLSPKRNPCEHCGHTIPREQKPWRLEEILEHEAMPIAPPPLNAALKSAWSKAPLLRDGRLDDDLADYKAAVPDFDMESFLHRVVGVFQAVQGAGRSGQWMNLLPMCTQATHDAIRSYQESFRYMGQRHVKDQVEIGRIELARIERDPAYTWITIRIWWTAVECIVDAHDRVADDIGPTRIEMSEYWTFQRTGPSGSPGAIDACPSCGGALDQIDEDGVCGSCSKWLCDGAYSFVLARRETVPGYDNRRRARTLDS